MGWAIRPDHLNGLGAWKSPPVWSSSAPRLGVFGDSFVQWYHPDGQHLADHLQDQLPELQVLGYGVGGYGLDQIVLSMEAQLPQLEGGHAVLGIMIMDLDRAILHFRHGPKPWFSLEHGTLTLHTAVLLAAQRLGLGPELRSELEYSQAKVLDRMAATVPWLAADAGRWIGEMEEIAETFAAAGLTPDFHHAAADIFRLLDTTPLASETREDRDPERSLDEAIAIFAGALDDPDNPKD